LQVKHIPLPLTLTPLRWKGIELLVNSGAKGARGRIPVGGGDLRSVCRDGS
jgi:hypothetical protein